MSHDNIGRSYTVGPSIPPLCPFCETMIYPGQEHTNILECFTALKAFVKQCQDELEESRMGSFQKPTREELIGVLNQMAVHFEDQGGLYQKYGKAIREVLSGKISYARYTQRTDNTGRPARYNYTQESVSPTEFNYGRYQERVAEDDVRNVLPSDVSDPQEDMDKDYLWTESPEDHPGA